MSRTVVVTGSASGIGRATAQRLRSQGDTVIGVDLDSADIVADLSTAAGRAAVVEHVHDRTRRLDGLVLCAGVGNGQLKSLSVNYFGVTELAVGLRPLLEHNGGGAVAVVASSAGTTQEVFDEVIEACLTGDEAAAQAAAERVDPQQTYLLYPTAKRALAIWVRRTCIEPGWASAGIAVNAIGPGVVVTQNTRRLMADPVMRERMDASMPMPLNGYARPDDVAKLLAWLVSADNTHVTGQLIHIDGGVDAALRGPDVFATSR